MENICKFSPTRTTEDNLNILNFVYEKQADFPHKFLTTAVFSMYVVTSGTGMLHTMQGGFPIKRGDLFFSLPAKPFYIENIEALQYVYISFMGRRADALLDRIQLTLHAPVYDGFDFLIPFWEESLHLSNSDNIDILAESVILYTFSYLCNRIEEKNASKRDENIILTIKKYLDDHYGEDTLSLNTVSELFSYNAKYISSKFLKTVGIGFNDYLTKIRLEHAVRLMESGFKNIQEIAGFSGYKDPLYFSRVFKKYHGKAPREYIADLHTLSL